MAAEQPSEREPAPAGRAVDEDGLLGVGGAAGVKTARWSSQRGDCAPVPTNYRHQPPPEPAVGRLMPDPLSLAHGQATKPSIFQLPLPISPLAHASIASSTRGNLATQTQLHPRRPRPTTASGPWPGDASRCSSRHEFACARGIRDFAYGDAGWAERFVS
jgi:hypothetical protein